MYNAKKEENKMFLRRDLPLSQKKQKTPPLLTFPKKHAIFK